MRKLIVGECDPGRVFHLVDPTQFLESDFEAEVVKALTCLMPDYQCGVFSGAFLLEGERRMADLALVHHSFSHWFVIEVELAGHSLENHVLPQVRCFRYGIPDNTCISSLLNAFGWMSREQAEALLRYVPHHVAVIGNQPDSRWTSALSALDTQHLTVSVYRNRNGESIHELEGSLSFRSESLGFAQYSAVDNCLRIPKSCGLRSGPTMFIDQFGNPSEWIVREEASVLWVSKRQGPALIAHNEYVQLIRTADGSVSLRLSGA